MAWNGYFVYDGTEIVNIERVNKYASVMPWFKDDTYWGLDYMLGLPEFWTTAGPDGDAPWYDTRIDSGWQDFLGFYPISITGAEDSTRSSAVVESVDDGGVAGRIRRTTKSVVFNGVLVAKSEVGAEYGLRWLSRVLLGGSCLAPGSNPLGAPLRYLASPPVPEPNPAIGIEAQYNKSQRSLHNVVFNSGPEVLSKRDGMDCGGSVWNIQFTGVAGTPTEFGYTQAILQDWVSGGDYPWQPGADEGDLGGPTGWTEVVCPDNLWDPVYDPECAALIVPPGPPSVPLGCYEPDVDLERYYAYIPSTNFGVSDYVPTIKLYASTEKRNVRLRWYRYFDGDFDFLDNSCNYIGDAVVSFVPADSSLVLDGITETVYVDLSDGRRRRADSLVFATDGKPFKWPLLTCGYSYVLTVDMPDAIEAPLLSLDITKKAL